MDTSGGQVSLQREEHLQPRKTQSKRAFKYDFENVKNDSKMEPTSSKNGSKISKMASKLSPKELPRRPPNGLEGFKMVQEAPRWPQGGPKRSPRSLRWCKKDPRWPKTAPKDPRWPQEGPRWPLKDPKRAQDAS